jgi:hypothetical protein
MLDFKNALNIRELIGGFGKGIFIKQTFIKNNAFFLERNMLYGQET